MNRSKLRGRGRRQTHLPVVISTRQPLHVRALRVGGAMLLVALGVWLLATRFPAYSGPGHPGGVSAEVVRLQDELAALRSELAESDHRAQIEQSTRSSLLSQLKALSDENALLKEDLAFFQTLMNSGSANGEAIAINRFRLRPEGLPGEFHYQLLVVQARTRSKEFQGRLQFVLDVEGAAQRPSTIVVPQPGEAAKEFNLNFKFYQRVDGVLRLSPGTKVKRAQIRVFERGTDSPRSTQTVVLS